MSMFGLVLRNVRRGWFRNLLLMLSIVIAYVLFGTLTAFERAYSSSADFGVSRMITANKLNFTRPLPMSHFRAVKELDGVGRASFATWFGGYYREPRNSLHTLAVDPRSYLAVYGDDLAMTEAERSSFIQDRASILVGQSLANRFGWRVGDQVPIINRRIARADGSQSWGFRVAGVFKGATAQIDTTFLYIHYQLLNEARASDRDTIGWIVTAPAGGQDPVAMGAAIDEMFQTSSERTTTDTERSFAQTFVAQFGDLALVTMLILGAAFFSLLVIVASTTALVIQRRTREIGILKAIGFSHARVLALLIGESLCVILAAGVAGLAIAAFVVDGAADSITQIAPGMTVSPSIWAIGLLSMLALTIVASAIPAWRAVSTSAAIALRWS